MDINKLDCKTCECKKQCEHDHGAEDGLGNGYTSVIGTHFCRASWTNFANSMNIPLMDLNIDI